MKIAIVINSSWNIYNFRLGLIKVLVANGHEIIAIAPKDDYSKFLEEKVTKYIPVKMDVQGINPLKDLLLIFRLYKIYKKQKPDVILHFTIKPNIYGSFAAWLSNIPAINNVSGLGTVFLKDNLLSKVSVLLYKITFKCPKKVFFQNRDDQNLFLDKKLVNQEITEIIPGSGIDLERFSKTALENNKVFKFLLISRIIRDKGLYEYIEAIKILKERGYKSTFQILGAKDPDHKRGIGLEEINSWINENIIEYLGVTDDVRPYIAKADCIVLPSYREGTPRTLIEAAAIGRPIVTTNVPGCKEVVDHNYNGLLCKVRDAIDLADKMAEIMSFEDRKLLEMGRNSRKKAEKCFDEKIVIKKYIETINILTNK